MRAFDRWPIRAAMGIVCAGSAAHADTSEDIQNASRLDVSYAHITLEVHPANAWAPPPRRHTLAPLASCAACSTFGSIDNMLHGAHAPSLLGAMTPMAIPHAGVVVGYRGDATTGDHVPVVHRGSSIVDVPLSSSYGVKAARALFMIEDGTIVGTYTGNDNIVRGYRFRAGATTTLPAIAGSWSVPTGVAADGSIAVNAGTIAAVVAPSGAVTPYGAPRGYTHFVVKDINKWGYAVGTATCSACTTAVDRAFVYIPGSGFTGLSSYVSNLAYADDAFSINDDNQIAIHGELDTVGSTPPPPDYYLLSL